MQRKVLVYSALTLCVLCVLGSVVQVVLWVTTQPALSAPIVLLNRVAWLLVLPVTFAAIAALIIARRPDNRVGWLLLLPALSSSTTLLLQTPANPPAGEGLTVGLWLLLWVDNWGWVLLIFPIFLIPLHFPTGHPPSPRWRWVNWLALGMWCFMMAAGALATEIGPIDGPWLVANPLGFIPPAIFGGPFLLIWGIGLLTMLSASVSALYVRFRQAPAAMRQQIKWLLFAGAQFVVVYAIIYFLQDSDSWTVGDWADLGLILSMLAIPLAIGVAILRYRLYDIDLLIRRTLQYSLLTVLLVVVYFGSVVVLQELTGRLLGERSPLVIVLSTLLIAALFNPLRRRVQTLVDRRFYRRKYDAARTLAAFGRQARDQTDVDALAAELARVVEETMQPEMVGVWHRDVRRR